MSSHRQPQLLLLSSVRMECANNETKCTVGAAQATVEGSPPATSNIGLEKSLKKITGEVSADSSALQDGTIELEIRDDSQQAQTIQERMPRTCRLGREQH